MTPTFNHLFKQAIFYFETPNAIPLNQQKAFTLTLNKKINYIERVEQDFSKETYTQIQRAFSKKKEENCRIAVVKQLAQNQESKQ